MPLFSLVLRKSTDVMRVSPGPAEPGQLAGRPDSCPVGSVQGVKRFHGGARQILSDFGRRVRRRGVPYDDACRDNGAAVRRMAVLLDESIDWSVEKGKNVMVDKKLCSFQS